MKKTLHRTDGNAGVGRQLSIRLYGHEVLAFNVEQNAAHPKTLAAACKAIETLRVPLHSVVRSQYG